MKIDIYALPPMLEFGQAEERFGLQLKRFSDVERMSVFDACYKEEFEQVQRSLDALVIGWQGVLDLAGNPIPFEGLDDNRSKVRNLGKFLGAIPMALQFEVLAELLAFIGLPRGNVDALVKLFAAGGEPPNLDPTTPPAGATPPCASSG